MNDNHKLAQLGRYDLIGKHQTTPNHYDHGGIEPIKFITSNKLDFLQGNVVKYVVRYKKKGTPLEDLNKARHYIDLMLKELEYDEN